MANHALADCRSPHELAWRRDGPVVVNLMRHRPEKGAVFVRITPDHRPRYGVSGRRLKRPCLMSGGIRRR